MRFHHQLLHPRAPITSRITKPARDVMYPGVIFTRFARLLWVIYRKTQCPIRSVHHPIGHGFKNYKK